MKLIIKFKTLTNSSLPTECCFFTLVCFESINVYVLPCAFWKICVRDEDDKVNLKVIGYLFVFICKFTCYV